MNIFELLWYKIILGDIDHIFNNRADKIINPLWDEIEIVLLQNKKNSGAITLIHKFDRMLEDWMEVDEETKDYYKKMTLEYDCNRYTLTFGQNYKDEWIARVFVNDLTNNDCTLVAFNGDNIRKKLIFTDLDVAIQNFKDFFESGGQTPSWVTL